MMVMTMQLTACICDYHTCYNLFVDRRRIEAKEMDREKKRDDKLRRRKERRVDREEKRRLQKLERKRLEEERDIQMRIAVEERKILIAHRKLETIRLLSELFNRIKVCSLTPRFVVFIGINI